MTQRALRLYREVHHLEKAVERKNTELNYVVGELNEEEFKTYFKVGEMLDKEWNK